MNQVVWVQFSVKTDRLMGDLGYPGDPAKIGRMVRYAFSQVPKCWVMPYLVPKSDVDTLKDLLVEAGHYVEI